jgi:hypothetical protein
VRSLCDVRDTAGSLDKIGLSAKCHFPTQFALAIQMFAHLTLGDGWIGIDPEIATMPAPVSAALFASLR